MRRASKYSPELRERAVRIVFDHVAALFPQTFWIFAREFSCTGATDASLEAANYGAHYRVSSQYWRNRPCW